MKCIHSFQRWKAIDRKGRYLGTLIHSHHSLSSFSFSLSSLSSSSLFSSSRSRIVAVDKEIWRYIYTYNDRLYTSSSRSASTKNEKPINQNCDNNKKSEKEINDMDVNGKEESKIEFLPRKSDVANNQNKNINDENNNKEINERTDKEIKETAASTKESLGEDDEEEGKGKTKNSNSNPSEKSKSNVDISKENYEKLSKQLKEGYYFSEIRKATDKNFKLLPTDRKIRKLNKEAYPFPSFEGDLLYDGSTVPSILENVLLGRKTPVTLVLLSFRQSGYLQLSAWRDVFDRTFINYPNIRSCQITFEDRWYMKAFKWLMVRGHKKGGGKSPSFLSPNAIATKTTATAITKSKIPQEITMDITVERQKSTFIRFGDTEEIRQGLQITNRMSGYVFLVDGKGNIRWRASGEPHERDLQMMQEAALEMIREMKSNRGSGGRHRK